MSKIIKTKNYKGLSFIETIINIYVYTVLLMICMTVSLTYIKSRIAIRQTQQAVEELSMTMNEMAKKIRMSSLGDISDGSHDLLEVISNDTTESVFYYNSVETGEYQNNLYIYTGSEEQLMMENVGSKFIVNNSSFSSNDKIPLIQIQLWKIKNGVEVPGTKVQTSVSMRSRYGE